MRIALLSDIHGNLVALNAVLAHIASDGPIDRFICLGDVAPDGPRPREVLHVLRTLDVTIIKGNADDHLLKVDLTSTEPTRGDMTRPRYHWIGPINQWGAAQLTDSDREFVRSFLPKFELSLGTSNQLLCYHGSPRHWTDNVLPATWSETLRDWFAGTNATLYAGGHTHEQMLRREGRMTIMNPGSVGACLDRQHLPHEMHFLPWADYALIESDGSQVEIQFRRVPIDRDALTADTRSSGMPFAEEWLSLWHW